MTAIANVTLVLDELGPDGTQVTEGYAEIVLSARVPDAGTGIYGQVPAQGQFDATGPPSVTLAPNDLLGPLQSNGLPGTAYTVSYYGVPGQPKTWSFYLLSTGGATQRLSQLATAPVAQPGQLAVTSVNGQAGAVVLTAAEVGADPSGAAAAAQAAAEAASLPVTGGTVNGNFSVSGGTDLYGSLNMEGYPVTGAAFLSSSGLAGATAASRYAGATAGGAPTTGTFDVGDFVIDTHKSGIWVCNIAGSPGTWYFLGPVNTFDTGWIQPAGTAAAVGNTGFTADAGHVHPGLSRVAVTANAGFALQNATPVILSWTAPNDGALHMFLVSSVLSVSSAETGGEIDLHAPAPSGAANSYLVLSENQPVGLANGNFYCLPVAAGATVSVSQGIALTAGAATLWAEIWAF